jgi:hypothetical protein
MSVDDAKVSAIINNALDVSNRNLLFTKVADAVESAWTSVDARRLQGDCDEDLAAAEHYLFCRYLIARYTPLYLPLLEAMSNFYDLGKRLGIGYQEGTCPQSRPSISDSRWKARGASDGSADSLGMTRLGHLGAPSDPSPGRPVSR